MSPLVLAISAAASLATAHCGGDGGGGESCTPDDQDGITGVAATFAIAVSDTAFAPAILKAQNRASVTLTLTNTGTIPHGFAVDCLATPNDRGCPTTSCFDAAATIAPIAPGASATIQLTTPAVEGIYVFRSSAPGDTPTGQFILQ